MGGIWHFLEKRGFDLLIVIAAVTGSLGTVLGDDSADPTGTRMWFEAVAMAVAVVALLWRHRFPFAAPATMWLLCAALSFVDGQLVAGAPGVFLAGMGAALLLGNLRNELEARVGLVIVVGCAAIVVSNHPGRDVSEFVLIPTLFAVAWLVGFALRERTEETEAAEERAARAEREREAAARVAVAEERARIARELHDVVAHAVSVMVLQVGAVRHRMSETSSGDREALKNVEQAGRTALAEMRRLLGAMRRDGDELELLPHPGLGDLESLLDDVRATGLDVRLRVDGEPVDLPPALDLSAFRILQEGLTNTLKHAHARRAEAIVRYGADELQVEVRDDGHGSTSGDGLGLGHGLVGVRERVKIYGGEMSAGDSPAGGFVIRARLPLGGYRS